MAQFMRRYFRISDAAYDAGFEIRTRISNRTVHVNSPDYIGKRSNFPHLVQIQLYVVADNIEILAV